jgi:hypothetical protein
MGNLADPEFEPTDEELRGLSARAFRDVGRRREEALRQLRAQIAARREKLRGEKKPPT